MRLNVLIRRLSRKIQEDGITQVIQDSVAFAKRGFSIRDYQSTRVDFDERWGMLKPHVDKEDQNLLDIGCAEGRITSNFAELGLFAIGLDRNPDTVQLARDRFGLREGIGFVRHPITPADITKLPEFDIVLLLTVYHHWYDEFGKEAAEDMLRTLGKKSRKIFFEVPDRPLSDGSVSEEIAQYYTDYLVSTFNGEVAVEQIGVASYRGNKREDVLFIIRCQDY